MPEAVTIAEAVRVTTFPSSLGPGFYALVSLAGPSRYTLHMSTTHGTAESARAAGVAWAEGRGYRVEAREP